MRQDQIETNSVSHLKIKLGTIQSLKVNFFENDKTPFYDGEINIYDIKGNEQASKAKLINEVRVQIKGTTDVNVLRNAKDTVSIIDLKGFTKLQGGGCFYFIVCISEQGLEKIYYYDFQPFELKQILKTKGHQETVTIDLKEFPSKNEDIVNILRTFAINLDYQSHNTLNADLSELSMQEISIKFHGRSEDYKKYINSGAIIYAKTQENINIPVGKIVPDSVKYYNDLYLKLPSGTQLKGLQSKSVEEKIEYVIENTLKFEFEEDKVHFNFQLDNHFTIDEIIKCVNNLEEIFTRGFYVGENFEYLIKINEYFPSDKLNKLEGLYEFRDELKEIVDLLNKLKVTTNIKYYALSDDDKAKLHNLLIEFNKESSEGKIVTFELEEKHYYFLKGKDMIGNIFYMDDELTSEVIYKRDGIKTSELKSYPSLFPRRNLSKTIDYDFDTIEKTLYSLYEINESTNEVNGYINDYILDLIKNYDENKNIKFLELAEKIAEELLKKSESNIYFINYYQILLRKRSLSFSETSHINKMLSESENLMERICLKILVGQATPQVISELSEAEQIDLRTWPIYSLYQA